MKNPASSQPLAKAPPDRGGFTLIEVLSVVAIIAILAAILIPALGNKTLYAKKVADASNLRQLGMALNSYLGDHNMLLPVCYVSFPCNPTLLSDDRYQYLSGRLASYLGVTGTIGEKVFVSAAQSPIFPIQINAGQAATAPSENSYRLVLGAMGKKNPFGGVETASPISALSINGIFNRTATTMPVLFDLDQGSDYATPSADGVPKNPVLVTGRNVLYLDGHVNFEKDLTFLQGFR